MEHKDINTATWQIKIKIKTNFMKNLPFENLQSRLPTATILAYTGHLREVIFIFQRLSHKSRAFIFNAKGLEGFLVKDDFHFYLRRLDQVERKSDQIVVTKLGDLTKEVYNTSEYEKLEQELKKRNSIAA